MWCGRWRVYSYEILLGVEVKSRLLVAVLVMGAVVLVAPKAGAQSNSGGWDIALAPYLWAAGMDGTFAIGDQEQDIDVPFSDIIDNLDFALMGHLDMRNEHWVISSDLVFVDVGQDENGEEVAVNFDMDMTLFEIAGGYRLSPVFTLLAGGRWVDMSVGLQTTGGLEDHSGTASKDWLDPLIGVHALVPLSEKWWLGMRGDVGGFGVGSELSWQAYADIGFRASHLISIVLGYHALEIDHESGGDFNAVEVDVMISGPQLGVVFTF